MGLGGNGNTTDFETPFNHKIWHIPLLNAAVKMQSHLHELLVGLLKPENEDEKYFWGNNIYPMKKSGLPCKMLFSPSLFFC